MEDTVDVWGLFDLEAPVEDTAQDPQPEGEQEQEVADPAGEGAQDQEVADPEHDDEDGSEDGQEPNKQPEDKKPLTREQRAANAQRRRQAEMDEAVSNAVQAALEKERAENNARWKKFFDQAQMKDQHQNGALIDSLEKAEQWAEQDRLARLQQNLKAGKLTAEDLQTAMEQSPAFKAMQQRQTAAEQAAAQQDNQRFTQNVEMELAQIQKINPEVKSLADIIRMPTGKDFGRYVQQYGMSYLEAYKLANHDQLVEQARTVAAAGAKVASAGKDHMTKTTTRGQTPIEVPKEVKESYRVFDPSMTDADIEKDYRKRIGR